MISDPIRRVRLRKVLVVIIIATIPCYLLGLIVLWIGNTAISRVTPTLTPTTQETVTVVETTPTLPIPTAQFPTATITETPENTLSPTVTSTYFIPSPTPTNSGTPTATPTITLTPVVTDTETTP